VIAHDVADGEAALRVAFQQQRHFVFVHAVAEIAKTDDEIKALFVVQSLDELLVQSERFPILAAVPRIAIRVLRVANQREADKRR